MKKILPLIVVTLVLFGCSKEKKLERLLHKKNGEWGVASINWEDTYPGDTTEYYTETGQTQDAGTFTFEKEDGKFEFKVNGRYYRNGFKWLVVDETIKVYRTFLFEGVTIKFLGYQKDDHSIILEGSYENFFEDRVLDATITLFR